MESFSLRLIMNFLPYLALDIFLFVVALYFLIQRKGKGTETILLFVGACLQVLAMLVRINYMFSFSRRSFSDYMDSGRMERLQMMLTFSEVFSIGGGLLVTIGLLLLINQFLKLQRPSAPY